MTATAAAGIRWKLYDLYAGSTDPQVMQDAEAAVRAAEAFAKAWRNRTGCLTDPVVLAEALDALDDVRRWYVRVRTDGEAVTVPSAYAHMLRIMDASDKDVKALATRLNELAAEAEGLLAFFLLSVGRIGPEDQHRLLEAPELEPYRGWLEQRFAQGPYELGEEAGRVAVHLGGQADRWYAMMQELLAEASAVIWDGEREVEVPFSAMSSLLTHPDARVRAGASEAMTAIMRRLAPMAAHELGGVIAAQVALAKLREYPSADVARFRQDGFDHTSIETMLQAIRNRSSVHHRFHELRARLLGAPQGLSYFERGAPCGNLPDGYDFEEVCRFVRTVLAKLDPEFAGILDAAMAGSRIDAEPRKGKKGGASCWISLISQAAYVTLQFTGRWSNVEDLVHELGHLIQYELQRAGKAVDFSVSMPATEISAMFFEFYPIQALLEAAKTDEMRLTLLMASLQNRAANIFRQAWATELERKLYEAVATDRHLTPERIGQLFTECMQACYGRAVRMDEGAEVWWVHWDHLRFWFYDYAYPVGTLVASAWRVHLAADPDYMGKIKTYLRAGGSASAPTLLAVMGIDLSDPMLWETGLGEFERDLEEAWRLARLLYDI